MPENIQRFCAGHENSMEWQFKLVAKKVQLGPVALGESHDKPYARAVICDLLEKGLINKRFLEMGELEEVESFRGDLLGQDITETQQWQGIEYAIRYCDSRHSNPIPFCTLIPLAVRHRVKVYFFDNAVTMEPAKSEGMKMRNETMGEVFRANVDVEESEPGVVVLIGGKHLLPIPSGGLFEHTIQYNCGIRFDHVINLGKLK